MNTAPFRKMHEREQALLETLLAPSFPGRDELAAQLATAMVRTFDEDGCLEFLIQSPVVARNVNNAVPTEGEYEDTDGMTVHVLLHVVHGVARELEFFREDNRTVQAWPRPDQVRVFAPD